MTEATYAGTTGHSGTDTSRAQAEDMPKHGRAQAWVLRSAANLGEQGVTIVDLRSWFDDMHHGTLSSALTNLHRAGRLARLTEKRDRCHIYVLPEYAAGRATEPPTVAAPRVDPAAVEQTMREEYDRGWQEGHDRGWQEGRAIPSTAAIREEGNAEGRRAAAHAVGQHINAMLAAMPSSSATHHERCWQKHPACALQAVRKVTIRMGEEGPL